MGIMIQVAKEVKFEVILSVDLHKNIVWQSSTSDLGDFSTNINCEVMVFNTAATKVEKRLNRSSKATYGTAIRSSINHVCPNLTLILQVNILNKNILSEWSGLSI
jgi:hypothetical protein